MTLLHRAPQESRNHKRRTKLIPVSLTLPLFLVFEQANVFQEAADDAARNAGDAELARELIAISEQLWEAIAREYPQRTWRSTSTQEMEQPRALKLTMPFDIAIEQHDGLQNYAEEFERRGYVNVAGQLRNAVAELQAAIDAEVGNCKSLAEDAEIPGRVAGYIGADGYRRIEVEGKEYRSDHMAFLFMTGKWPVHGVVHLNGDKADDRWENLADAAEDGDLEGSTSRPAGTDEQANNLDADHEVSKGPQDEED
jgi:hypothetical protein